MLLIVCEEVVVLLLKIEMWRAVLFD